jgi:hypothetical protein
MKIKIQAGAELDIATPDEVRREIQAVRTSWMAEVAKGDRFINFYAGSTPAAGSVTIGDLAEEIIGPREGFVWAIKRLSVVGYDPSPGTDSLALYKGDVATPSATIIAKLLRDQFFSGSEIVLYPGDTLLASGTVAAATKIWLTGQARELPISLAWRL